MSDGNMEASTPVPAANAGVTTAGANPTGTSILSKATIALGIAIMLGCVIFASIGIHTHGALPDQEMRKAARPGQVTSIIALIISILFKLFLLGYLVLCVVKNKCGKPITWKRRHYAALAALILVPVLLTCFANINMYNSVGGYIKSSGGTDQEPLNDMDPLRTGSVAFLSFIMGVGITSMAFVFRRRGTKIMPGV